MDKIRYHRLCYIIGATYISIFSFLFFYDEPLNPEAAAFADLSSENVLDSENAYFAFIGFSAASGADIHKKGVEMVKTIIPNPRSLRDDSGLGKELLVRVLDFKIGQLNKTKFQRQTDKGFLPFARESRTAICKLVADNQELLSRYKKLQSYPHYQEPTILGPYQPIPLFEPIRNMNWLVLVDLAVKINDGNIDEALQRLEADVRFWRHTMREGRSLIIRLIAGHALRRDYLFLSEIVRSIDIKNHEKKIEGILTQLEPEELDMTRVSRYEYNQAASTAQVIHKCIKQARNPFKGEWAFTQYPIYKPNATINEIYMKLKKDLPLASMPQTMFQEKAQESQRVKTLQTQKSLNTLYNLMGSISSENVNIQFAPYIAKAHELEGFRRLVALQFEAKKQHIGVEKMGDFVQTLGAAYADPFTGKPMMWDLEKRCLFFNKLKESGDGRVELRLSKL